MPFSKSPEDKAQKQADRESKAHAASPVGRAEAAYERGDTFFQVEIDVQPATPSLGAVVSSVLANVLPRKASKATEVPRSTDVLGDIERVGWHLEHAGYVYVQIESSSIGGDSSQTTTYRGKSVGIYLFRRQDADDVPRADPAP